MSFGCSGGCARTERGAAGPGRRGLGRVRLPGGLQALPESPTWTWVRRWRCEKGAGRPWRVGEAASERVGALQRCPAVQRLLLAPESGFAPVIDANLPTFGGAEDSTQHGRN